MGREEAVKTASLLGLETAPNFQTNRKKNVTAFQLSVEGCLWKIGSIPAKR
jgi:hypothetical protein